MEKSRPSCIRPALTTCITTLILLLSAGLHAAPPAYIPDGAKALEGVIIRVVSAKEMVLWQKGKLHPFTLYGIDLPAPNTPEGLRAKKDVSDMIFNTLLSVYLVPEKKEPPQGIVVIRGRCLNLDLVRSGKAAVSKGCTIKGLCDAWKNKTP